MKGLKRLVYGLVGVAGVGTLVWIFQNWVAFIGMGIWTILAIILLTLGGINWGVKAIFGRDLFGILGM